MSEPAADSKVYIGPAGWSYPDWKGVVYPSGTGRDFDPLEYLARYFNVIEINTSFYRPPPKAWTLAWVERLRDHPRFRFTAKLWRRFTHQRDAPPTQSDVTDYREGIDVLAAEDRLLAVLVQFPWSFRNRPPERQWLENVVTTFGDYPLVLEVRHESWDDRDTLEWLREHKVGLAMIDQPLHAGSLEAVDRRTGLVSYARLHGRNFDAWFAEGRPSSERYDYLYERDELVPWVERIQGATNDSTVETVIAITNNHYQGQGVVNALQLKAWTSGERVSVPEPLLTTYPDALADVAAERPAQPGLFDAGGS